MKVTCVEGWATQSAPSHGSAVNSLQHGSAPRTGREGLWLAKPIRCLLDFYPGIRACQLKRHIREENPQRLAVACAAMVQGHDDRASLLVIQPLRVHNINYAVRPGAQMPGDLLDPVVRPDVQF